MVREAATTAANRSTAAHADRSAPIIKNHTDWLQRSHLEKAFPKISPLVTIPIKVVPGD